MAQSKTLLLSGVLTGLVLVIIGGIVARTGMAVPAAAVVAGATSSPVVGQTRPVAPRPATDEAPAAPAGDLAAGYIPSDEAASRALQAAPGGRVLAGPELVSLQGTPAYEVVLDQGAVYIDARSGQVLANQTVRAAPSDPREGDRGESTGRSPHDDDHDEWEEDDDDD